MERWQLPSKEPALGQWSCGSAGKWSRVQGAMGFRPCIPFLLRLPVATATREQEHHFHGILLGKGEAGCASGRGVGSQDGALPVPSVSIENPSTSIPTTNPVWTGLTILPPPQRDAGIGWAMPGCGCPSICPCRNEAATTGHIPVKDLGAERWLSHAAKNPLQLPGALLSL